ncbi:MAG: thioredoxin [Lachnospiraceae bacterium]|nr:thioredoxin [Lachnospiraceae bacterium]
MAVIEVTMEDFDEKVLHSVKPVVVDFWAPWCGPCKMMGKVIDAIADERNDIIVAKLNVDEAQVLAASYGVSAIPNVALFKDGKIIANSVGFVDKATLISNLGL